MTLPEYIQKIGDKQFAAKFGITERTAASYRHRTRRPRAELAERIVNESPVSWEGIYSNPSSSSNAA